MTENSRITVLLTLNIAIKLLKNIYFPLYKKQKILHNEDEEIRATIKNNIGNNYIVI